jgi:hypothetical protein
MKREYAKQVQRLLNDAAMRAQDIYLANERLALYRLIEAVEMILEDIDEGDNAISIKDEVDMDTDMKGAKNE